MKAFAEQREVQQVETVKDICRFEFPINDQHMVEQDVIGDITDPDTGDVTQGKIGTEMVDDGGPDIDLFVYVGGERSEHRRQVPRDKVIAGFAALKVELLKVYNHAE